MTQRIVVLGGTGFVGQSVCEHLARRLPGVRIVVPTRRPRQGLGLQSLPGVEMMVADVRQPDAMRRALVRADAVVNLIAILHGNAQRFEAVHATLPRQLASVCHDLHIRQVVHVSALGADPTGPSMYLRSKGVGERALSAPGPITATILRPSVIFGAHDRFMNLFARMQAIAPVVPLAGADARFQPVWVDDVARAIVHCLRDPLTTGQVYECCGPTVYTLADLVRLAGRISGHPRPVIPLPDGIGRLQATLMRLLPGEPLMSTDNLDSMRTPSVATAGRAGLRELGIEPAALEAVLPGYLGPGRLQSRLDRWRSQS